MWSDWLVFCECGFNLSALWCPLSAPTVLLGFFYLGRGYLLTAAAPDLGCGVSLLCQLPLLCHSSHLLLSSHALSQRLPSWMQDISCTGHSKHRLPTTQEKTLLMDITRWPTQKSDWLYSLQLKMGKLYTISKNKTGRWLWLRSWTPYCQIQT